MELRIQNNITNNPNFTAKLLVFDKSKLKKDDISHLNEIADKIGNESDTVIISKQSIYANIGNNQVMQKFPDTCKTKKEHFEFVSKFLNTLLPKETKDINGIKKEILEDNVHPEKVLSAIKIFKTYVKKPNLIITDYDNISEINNLRLYPDRKFPDYSDSAKKIINDIINIENNVPENKIKEYLKTIPNLIRVSDNIFYYGYDLKEDLTNSSDFPYNSWLFYNRQDKTITLSEKKRSIKLTPESNYKKAITTCSRDNTDNSICYTEYLNNKENLITKLHIGKNHKIDSFVQALVNDFGITKFKIFKNADSDDIVIRTLNHNHTCQDIKMTKDDFYNIGN